MPPAERAARAWRVVCDTRVLVAVASVVLAWLCLGQLTAESIRVAGTTGTAPRAFIAEIPQRGGTMCQPQSTLLREAGSFVVTMGTYGRPGPAVRVFYRSATGTAVPLGRVAKGWAEGVVTVSLRRLDGNLEGGSTCLQSAGGARVAFAGEGAAGAAVVDDEPQSGRVSITAYTRSAQSTLSLLPELGRRLGRGNADFIGPWTLWLTGLLLVGGFVLGGYALVLGLRAKDRVPADDACVRASGLRGRVGRIPASGRAVALAAASIGLAWALLTPPFQVPDETAHAAYVQYLAETGKLPKEVLGTGAYSGEENALLGAIGFARVIGRPGERVLSTAVDERYLRSVEAQPNPPEGNGNVSTASNNPPLYYLLQTPVYLATSSGGLLTQLVAMRVLSVLFVSLSVLLAFLFVRELLPRSPQLWVLGGLAAAFQPVLGFIGSGVNPDSLLYLCASGTLWLAARILRRGLTVRRAAALGGFVLAGLLTKPLFMALVPPAAVAVLVAAARDPKGSWRAVLAGAAVVAVPMAIYIALAASVLDHPYFGVAVDVANRATGAGSSGTAFTVGREISFVLQQFLPRLPFLQDFVPGFPARDTWLNGLVGVFGWLDYQLAYTKVQFAYRLVQVLLVLVLVALVSVRRDLRRHLPLAVVCLIAMASLFAVIGVTDYQAFNANSPRFQQARYLLPLLALYAGLFALAGRGLGRHLARLALPALWVLVSLHTFAAMVLTANRYYL